MLPFEQTMASMEGRSGSKDAGGIGQAAAFFWTLDQQPAMLLVGRLMA